MKTNKEIMWSFRFTVEETIELEKQMKLAGVTNRTKFIKAIIFSKPLKVVSVDKNTHEMYKILVDFQAQYKAIGNNYNQATKAINAAFSEKQALSFIYKLREITLELIQINKEVIRITKEFQEKWLPK